MRPAGLLRLALAAALAMAATASAQESLIDTGGQSARVSRARGAPGLAPPGLSRVETLRAFLRARHDEPTLRDLVQTREHVSGGVVHQTYKQTVGGLDVYGTSVKAAFGANGELRSVIETLVSTARVLRPSQVGPADAVRVVLHKYYPGLDANLPEVSTVENVVTYQRRAPFSEAPTATRVALPLRNGVLDAGYLVVTWDRDNVLRHTAVSGRGEIVGEQLRTNPDGYRIFPNHPGVTPQVLVNSPADPVASPIGWVTSDTTTGNNVDAYLDRDANGQADLNGRPIASSQLFDFTWDSLLEPTTSNNQRVAVTNLFYLNNRLHDRLYGYGFTESAGNFQTNNFGNGGAGGDHVKAEAQDGSGTNNANFATPPDGQSPTMQMYLWNTSVPGRDGDLDSDIVYHEYGHGLTWRMIGDMSGVTGMATGEGMSDALAIYFNGDDRVAEYSSNNPIGIRNYPYTNYPRTYRYVTGITGPHLDGEIFAAAMWRTRELWLGQGWSQDSLLTHIVDGMNYVPAKPAYEHMRDGFLQSIANAGGTQAQSCTVWRAFAQYGVGVGALGREVCALPGFCFFQAFDSFVLPPECPDTPVNTAPLVIVTQPTSGGTVAAGTAVTFTGSASDPQDGDLTAALVWSSSLQGQIGTGGSFSRSDLVAGTHLITATATDSGSLAGSDAISLTVQAPSNTPPTVLISLPTNGSSVQVGTSVSFLGSASDSQDGNLTASMTWNSNLQGALGTGGSFSRSNLVVGTHTITASAVDNGGLTGSAGVTLTVQPPPNTPPVVTITAPANGVMVTAGTSVTFIGSAQDAQDGNVSASLVWRSHTQGVIGTGASFSTSVLTVGSHSVTAEATDSAQAKGSATVVVNVQAAPPPYTLSATPRLDRKKRLVDLVWSGATGASVSIYRSNVLVTTTPNDGAHTDQPTGKATTFTYRVCNAGTQVCSNSVTVTF